MLKYIWGQTATAEMMLIRVAFGWNPSSSLKHIVMHSLSKLFVCMYPVPFKWFFSLFWPKDVCFALRHWMNNQQDLRVGLGFLQAVILRVLLRHKHHLLTPVSMEKRVKNSLFWGFSFYFCGRMQINKMSTVCATTITKMCTVGQILKEPTAYNHSSFFSPLCLSEDT